MAAYADYEFYTDTYLGAAIAQADFDRLALRASEAIDAMTFQRAVDVTDEDVVELRSMATCAVAETIQEIEKAGGAVGIQSERVGNHSVTYTTGSAMQQTTPERLLSAAKTYLLSTGLLYRGFLEGEYAQ